MNIALIGYRGSGKSTVGKLLADRLHLTFVDADDLITHRAGKSIRDIFATAGETAFRDLESEVVADIMANDNQVIALGGGAILRPQNLARIKAHAKIVYLHADAKTLHTRIAADPATAHARPHLTPAGGSLAEVTALLATRDPAYRAAADILIDVQTLTPTQAADQLAHHPLLAPSN